MKELSKTQMDITHVQETEIYHPWIIKQPQILLDLVKYPKANSNPITFKDKLLSIQNNYPNHLPIYTDGSKLECVAILNKRLVK